MVVVGDDDVTFGAALFGAAPCGGIAPSASTDPAAAMTTSEAAAAEPETCCFPILGNESVSIETAEASAL